MNCSSEDAEHMCYPEMPLIGKWLNETDTKLALGVDPDFSYSPVNMTVNSAFYLQGQAMLNSAALLPELLHNGIRVLAFAGDTGGVAHLQFSRRLADCHALTGRWYMQLRGTSLP